MKKKFLSLLMIIALLMTMMPTMMTTAFAGQHLSKCPFCGSSYFDEGGGSYVAPTCTKKGSVKIYCSCCPGGKTYTIKALGHKWANWANLREATCAEEGELKKRCDRCGKIKIDTLSKKPHTYGEWTIIQEPTENTAGLRERTCKKCGHVEQKEFYPEGTLYKDGDNDKDAVKKLQTNLNKTGNDCGKVDGIFGKNTKKALEDFQKKTGLNPDGIAWPETMELLEELANKGLALVVKQTSPDRKRYYPGDTISYSIELINTGLVLLTHPRVEWTPTRGNGQDGPTDFAYNTDPTNPDGGTIGPGESHLTEFSYIFTQEDADCDSAKVAMKFLGIAEQPDGSSVYSEEQWFPYEMAPEYWVDLTVTDKTGKASYAENDEVIIEATVTNMSRSELQQPGLRCWHCDNPGGNIPDGFQQDVSKVMQPGEAFTYSFRYTVTAKDAEAGKVNFGFKGWMVAPMAGAQGQSKEVEDYNALEIKTRAADDPQVADEEYHDSVRLTVKDTTGKAVYAENDAVVFEATLTNTSNRALNTPRVDYVNLKNRYSYLGDLYDFGRTVEPGDSFIFHFTYTVTAEDVSDEGAAFVFHGYMMPPIPSGQSTTDCVEDYADISIGAGKNDDPQPEDIGIELIKREKSTSADSRGYASGETVTYEITVRNNGNETLTDVEVMDPLKGSYEDAILATGITLAPGDSQSFEFSYTVKPGDIPFGSITNIAKAFWFDAASDTRRVILSNSVTVQLFGEDPQVGVDLVATKEEYSASADPAGYALGEQVVFKVCIENNSELAIWFEACDWTEENISNPLGYLTPDDMVLPGESKVYYTTPYTITSPDVVNKSVSNEAIFRWKDRPDINEALRSGTLKTNKVTVPVIGDDPIIVIPPQPEPDGKIKTPVLGGDCCSRSLKYLSEYDEEYLLHYCTDHNSVRQMIAVSLESAQTDDEKIAVWQQAYLLWQQQLDAMYDACEAAADEAGSNAVVDAQTKFYKYLTDLQNELALLYPDNPAFVWEKVADVLMNKVADMCYLLHTAPDDRVDSYFTGDYESISGIFMDYDSCTFGILKDEGSDVTYMRTLCASHYENDCEALSFVMSEPDTASAFQEASQMWLDMLNGLYRKMYEGHGGNERTIIASECKSYNEWLAAYQAFIHLFYPDKPEVTAEMVYAEVRTKCMTLCGEISGTK